STSRSGPPFVSPPCDTASRYHLYRGRGHDVCPRPKRLPPARVSTHQMDIPTYEPAAALDFFKAGGEVETIPAGRTIFREDRGRRSFLCRDSMYLVLKGGVSLTAAAHEIRSVKAGEIFGEMAALARTPRSAT